ncbi:MAG: acyl-CoA thioesterase [Spirochaetaceae bacterium]|jgi:acyl-CoA thioester hydrolase|nr:acyl-CoA thioesterase [Spirochaetaceae bacterium]
MQTKEISAEIEFSVEFYDVDPMNVVWHGNYIKYFEKARCALLHKIGCGYNTMKEYGFAFPVTSIAVKYIAPLYFGEKVRARAVLCEYENCLKIKYELYKADSSVLSTKGSSSQMAYNIAKNESCFTCPQFFIAKVEALLAKEGEK